MHGDELLLVRALLECTFDSHKHDIRGVALHVLEARVQLHILGGLWEECLVCGDLRELQVVCDQEHLVRVRALVRDDQGTVSCPDPAQ